MTDTQVKQKVTTKQENKLMVSAGKFKTTAVEDNKPKVVQLATQQNIYHPNSNGERFLGENVAKKYLAENHGDADLAWSKIRAHRNTYKGLREEDRNAEHYLYALSEVKQNQEKWFEYYLLTPGYSLTKLASIQYHKITGGQSDFRGSPPSIDELRAGLLGADDGLKE